MVRVTFLATPSKRSVIEAMASKLSPRIVCDIVSTRYPIPKTEWGRMRFTEKLDEKLLGGPSIREHVMSFDPDIVYSDSPLYASQFKLASRLSRKRRPLVLNMRGDVWRENSAAFSSVAVHRRLLLLQQFSYDWTAVAMASKVTTVCRWLQAVVTHHVPRKRCEVIYVGIDPGRFEPQAGFEARKPAVAILQNHSILPKVEGLLNFRAVIERLPQTNFYIAEGEAWAQQFLSRVKEHFRGLSNVHFVRGITSSDAVSQLLTACDCYVLASGLDCCPTTVLEASLLERPVLASRVGGVPEIIREGYTGWTVDNRDINTWVEKIQILSKDDKLRRLLGRQGRQWVLQKFTWATIAPQVERLIIHEVERSR